MFLCKSVFRVSIFDTAHYSAFYGPWKMENGDVIERSSPLFSGIAIEQWHKISHMRWECTRIDITFLELILKKMMIFFKNISKVFLKQY